MAELRGLLLIIILSFLLPSSSSSPPPPPLPPPHPILCSSCGAVVQELLLALDAEITLSGATVNYEVNLDDAPQEVNIELTEARVLSIIDGLCDTMTDYHLFEAEFVKLVEGSEKPTETKAERKAKKQLKKYCEALVEEHEDILMAAIKGKEIAGTNTDNTEQSPLLRLAWDLMALCGKQRANACDAKQLRAQEDAIKSHLESSSSSSSSTRGRQKKPTDEELEGISAVPGN